jgi:hypothetical protein
MKISDIDWAWVGRWAKKQLSEGRTGHKMGAAWAVINNIILTIYIIHPSICPITHILPLSLHFNQFSTPFSGVCVIRAGNGQNSFIDPSNAARI